MAIATIAGLSLAAGSFAMQSMQAGRQNRYARQLQIQRNEQYLRNVQYQRELMAFYTKRYQETAKAAMQDAEQQYATVFDAINQRRQKASQTISQYSRQAGAASARFRTTDTETTGQSKQLALQEFEAIEARAAAVVHDNLEGSMRQSQRQLASIRATAQNRINQAMPQPMQPLYPGDQVQGVYQPGGLDLALSLGNVLASSYRDSANRQPPGTDPSFMTILEGMA